MSMAKEKLMKLGELSDGVLDIDIKLRELITVVEVLENSITRIEDGKYSDMLSLILYYLKHVEKELNEYGNQLDLYWLHLGDNLDKLVNRKE